MPEIESPAPEELQNTTELQLSKECPLIADAIVKTKTLLERIYLGAIPENLTQRLDSLSQQDKIITSKEQIVSRLAQTKASPLEIAMTKGFFDSEQDKIYLLESSTLNEQIHEILHYLSYYSDNDQKHFGLRGDDIVHARRGVFLNEGITMLLSIAAQYDVDLTGPLARSKLMGAMRLAKGDKALNFAMSYKTTLDTLFNYLFSYPQISTHISQLSKDYFAADPKAFYDHLKTAVGTKGVKQFDLQMESKPKMELQRTIQKLTTNTDTLISSISGYSLDLRMAVATFCQCLDHKPNIFSNAWDILHGRKSAVKLEFEYPEFTRGLIAIAPAMDLLGLHTDPLITVNLTFAVQYQNREFKNSYLDEIQSQAFIIWQAAKLEAAKRGEMLENNDFFGNPYIQEFLGSLNPDKVNRIQLMAWKLLGTKITDEQQTNITLQQQTQTIGSTLADYLNQETN